jgi:hypothetical protein
MLGHETGVIGLPLGCWRARFMRASRRGRAPTGGAGHRRGEDPAAAAALLGLTVEAMPRETDAAFVAIDEVQLAGDLERGHVFTDRILNLRGSQETLLLGRATMRGIIEQLLPGVHVVTRPRMSVLSYAGPEEADAAAGALGRRDLLGRRGLCRGRADPPSARRRGGRARAPVARGPATSRSRSISRATWISWSPPTRSAWG